MDTILFIDLQETHLPELKKIYDFYVEESTATFHIQKQSLSQLKEFIPINHPKYKSYIIKNSNEILGYCYFGAYKSREAFSKTAEVTIYLKQNSQKKGVGQRALKHLEKAASQQGIKVLLAVITGENQASIRFFKKAGYQKCGLFKEVGEKFKKTLDLFICQKFL